MFQHILQRPRAKSLPSIIAIVAVTLFTGTTAWQLQVHTAAFLRARDSGLPAGTSTPTGADQRGIKLLLAAPNSAFEPPADKHATDPVRSNHDHPGRASAPNSVCLGPLDDAVSVSPVAPEC